MMGLLEHSIRYRAYHAKVRQMGRDVPRLPVAYEELANNTDSVLLDIFCFIGVEPLSVAQLQENLAQQWHFMGNSSLFGFDGTFRVSHHDLPVWLSRLISFLAGTGSGA